MKKVLIIMVVLLSFGVIAFGIFYASTHDFSVDREEDEHNNVELNEGVPEVNEDNSVTLVSTEAIDDSFVQTYQVVINGAEKTLEIEFLYRDNTSLDQQSLTGEYSGATLYAYYEDYDGTASGFDENMIASSFNEGNFSFIQGVDGDSYLMVHTNIYDDGAGEEDKLYILNENLEFVSNDLVDYTGSESQGMSIMSTYTTYTLEDDEYPWYTDAFNACSSPSNCYINVRIEENRIYYLVPVLNEVSEEVEEEEETQEEEEVTDYGELEERIYTIDDGVLSYEVIKRYTITGLSGLTE